MIDQSAITFTELFSFKEDVVTASINAADGYKGQA